MRRQTDFILLTDKITLSLTDKITLSLTDKITLSLTVLIRIAAVCYWRLAKTAVSEHMCDYINILVLYSIRSCDGWDTCVFMLREQIQNYVITLWEFYRSQGGGEYYVELYYNLLF